MYDNREKPQQSKDPLASKHLVTVGKKNFPNRKNHPDQTIDLEGEVSGQISLYDTFYVLTIHTTHVITVVSR